MSFPLPDDLPHPEIKPVSPALREDPLPIEPLGKSKVERGERIWLVSSRPGLSIFSCNVYFSNYWHFLPPLFFCCCCFIFIFRLSYGTRGILVPLPGMEPMSPALEARSLNHWTTRQVPPFGVLSATLATSTPTEQVGGRRINEGFAIR